MTTSTYPVLTEAENVFKMLIWAPMIKAGEIYLAGLQATIPVLDLPVIQGLEDDIIQYLTDSIYAQVVKLIDLESIQLVNAELQSKWSTASESLALIAQEQGVTSSAYQTALSNAASDFASWVNTGG